MDLKKKTFWMCNFTDFCLPQESVQSRTEVVAFTRTKCDQNNALRWFVRVFLLDDWLSFSSVALLKHARQILEQQL